MPAVPLPVRDGLNPTRLRLPERGPWATVLEYLLARFPDDATRLREKVSLAEVVGGDGVPLTAETAFVPRSFVYLYRDPPVETRVPFEIEILHRDQDLLVVDKPHFLSSTPRGRHIVESALVRLRRDLDLPELTPAHRLDRVTAGVLVFTVRQEARRAYQLLFEQRLVTKEYQAIAGYDPALTLPRTVHSRIVKERGMLQCTEVPGEPNAHTRIELLEVREELARYRLLPRTGKMHQLRVHLNSLGIPILGDNFYPRLYDIAPEDYSDPLQLLARSVEFTDPHTGEPRRFVSRRGLSAWEPTGPPNP